MCVGVRWHPPEGERCLIFSEISPAHGECVLVCECGQTLRNSCSMRYMFFTL